MKAYAILDGGGIKGAALAGCLAAGEELQIEFAGYGGTSAGSIVALLASLGYSGQDLLHMMVDEIDFSFFLDDGGEHLSRLAGLARRLENAGPWRSLGIMLGSWLNQGRLWRHLRRHLGLYRAGRLQGYLLGKIVQKYPELRGRRDVSFAELLRRGGRPLKVVASDIGLARPVVFSAVGEPEQDGLVLDAVRASMSYPFVFEPVVVFGRHLVDGALSSNLPVFLFDRERQQDGLPVIAFDLVSGESRPAGSSYGLLEYSRDLLNTALESGDELLRQLTRGLYHVRVVLPGEIHALDFGLPRQQRLDLWRSGHSQTHSFFRKVVPHWLDAQDEVERLQALYTDPKLVKQVLEVFVREIEQNTPARLCRAQIMLPTGRATRQVVYHCNMDGDADSDLELAMDGGCTGRAWTSHKPQLADLEEAHRELGPWKMTARQYHKVRQDRKAMLCVPIFDPAGPGGASEATMMPVLGTLSLDSATRLADTEWLRESYAVRRAQFWADVLARLLSRR